MVPVEWPLAAPAADRPVEPARTRGSRRLASVRRDFFLDPAHRLTEQERALMTAMLNDLVGSVSSALLAAVPTPPVLLTDASSLTLRLSAAGLLDREELVSLLLMRADEHRIASAFAGRAGPRRLADLSAVEAQCLASAVAAGLSGAGAADRPALAEAASAVASGHDQSESLDSAVDDLALALEAAGRLDDKTLETVMEDGEAVLLAALLARRAGISAETGWGYLVGGQDGGLALLARMAGLARPSAARLIAEFAALSGASVEEEAARFDELGDEVVEAALAWWRLPPPFRDAATALGEARG
jgi:hypothetical protein